MKISNSFNKSNAVLVGGAIVTLAAPHLGLNTPTMMGAAQTVVVWLLVMFVPNRMSSSYLYKALDEARSRERAAENRKSRQ